MAPKPSKLAKQYQKALEELDAARRAADAARAAWLGEAAAQRADLLAELAEFGAASGLDVDAADERVSLAWRGRSLLLSGGAEGDTIATDAGPRIALSPGGEWTVGGEPLFDLGLRRLLCDALGVPDPKGELTAPPAARPQPPPRPVAAAPEPAPTAPSTVATVGYKPPGEPELGHLGRSGTRGFKRSKDVPPGSVVKDLKGPGPV